MASLESKAAGGNLVIVRQYLRFRLGQWQTVRSHSRRRPCINRAYRR